MDNEKILENEKKIHHVFLTNDEMILFFMKKARQDERLKNIRALRDENRFEASQVLMTDKELAKELKTPSERDSSSDSGVEKQ